MIKHRIESQIQQTKPHEEHLWYSPNRRHAFPTGAGKHANRRRKVHASPLWLWHDRECFATSFHVAKWCPTARGRWHRRKHTRPHGRTYHQHPGLSNPVSPMAFLCHLHPKMSRQYVFSTYSFGWGCYGRGILGIL